MSIRDLKGSVENRIPIKNVLISVFDKEKLDFLIPGLIIIGKKSNYDVKFMSTGGTYERIKDLLGTDYKRLIEVSEYTGFPEMEGGLVKTLHPKIHAGILGERNNLEHKQYLKKELDNAVYIDLIVGNLYPFDKVISSPDTNFEKARGNIDIGGPTMIRGGAKNFLSCAVLCNPTDYTEFLKIVGENKGCTTFEQRLNLAKKVFAITSEYDASILKYMKNEAHNFQDIKNLYKFSDEI